MEWKRTVARSVRHPRQRSLRGCVADHVFARFPSESHRELLFPHGQRPILASERDRSHPSIGRPTDFAQASLLHADAVKQALVHIEARCTHDRVSGTGFVVDMSQYGLIRDALVMTAWHVIQPPECSGQKVDVTLSGPGVGELTLSDALGSHLVFPKEDPRKLGLDVALLQVNAKEAATAPAARRAAAHGGTRLGDDLGVSEESWAGEWARRGSDVSVLYRDVAQKTPDGLVAELLLALTGEPPRVISLSRQRIMVWTLLGYPGIVR